MTVFRTLPFVVGLGVVAGGDGGGAGFGALGMKSAISRLTRSTISDRSIRYSLLTFFACSGSLDFVFGLATEPFLEM